jgi:hypothetical protein
MYVCKYVQQLPQTLCICRYVYVYIYVCVYVYVCVCISMYTTSRIYPHSLPYFGRIYVYVYVGI